MEVTARFRVSFGHLPCSRPGRRPLLAGSVPWANPSLAKSSTTAIDLKLPVAAPSLVIVPGEGPVVGRDNHLLADFMLRLRFGLLPSRRAHPLIGWVNPATGTLAVEEFHLDMRS